jgi:hypothetical protein
MKCSKVTSLLQAYLDNELTASKEALVEHHLKGCALCRMQLSAFKKTSEVMDLWSDKEPRRDLVSPVVQILRHEQETPSAFQRFLALIIANKRKILAVGANLVILLLFAFNIPVFFRQPVNKAGILSDNIPVTRENNRSSATNYDPVDMTAYFSNAIDEQNLNPVERDMMLDNFLNDANEITNGSVLPSPNTGIIKVRRVRVIYTRNSKMNEATQQVIFIQQAGYEKIK